MFSAVSSFLLPTSLVLDVVVFTLRPGCAGEEGALECARHVFVYEVPKIMESKLWEWLPKLSAYYSVCKYNCVVIISLKNSQPLDW